MTTCFATTSFWKRFYPLVMLAAFLLIRPAMGAGARDPQLDIIPRPQSVERHAGSFTLNTSTVLVASGKEARHVADMFNQLLEANYGFTLRVTDDAAAAGTRTVAFRLATDGIPSEGYSLGITRGGVTLEGSDGPGLFHGMQSLVQLLPVGRAAAYELPCVQVRDQPRFRYRGMHLDCGRHFFPVSFIKEYLDMMARYKFNTFHWHLTEDQGWRIEIKRYPRLTSIGSQRKQTVVGHNTSEYDGTPYGGYYTQDQITDIVRYATDRYITIIPEIEMPGHALAALTSYPLLGCTTGPYAVATRWGVFPDVYCPGKESTFQFLENVLDEVMALFPSHYIHIGGDECPKDRWKQCPYCQQRIKTLGLKDEEGLQSYFVGRIEKYLNQHGRAIIGWDEILEGGLAPNATVMSWRGEKGGIAAAQQHHDVIMTPGGWCYFDHAQSRSKEEPLNIGGYLPLSKVYGYDPVPRQLQPDERKYIIGVQANLWTEYIPSVTQLEYMVMPRMLAMAEIAWTDTAKKDYAGFYKRMGKQLDYLDTRHIHFRIPEPGGLESDTTGKASRVVTLTPAMDGVKMYYTLDGSTPTPASTPYTAPVRRDLHETPKAVLKVIEVTPSGNQSIPYEATFVHKEG
jgi:hexosaminidase